MLATALTAQFLEQTKPSVRVIITESGLNGWETSFPYAYPDKMLFFMKALLIWFI